MGDEARLAAITEAAEEIITLAKSEDREPTEDEAKRLEDLATEGEGIKARLDRKAKSAATIARLDTLGKGKLTPANADQARTLGEHFIKTRGKALVEAKGVSGATVAAPEWLRRKANTDTQDSPAAVAPWVTEFDTSIVEAYRRPLVVADLLSPGTLSGNAITYLVEGALEGDFQNVAEGQPKPQIHFADPTTVTETLKKIAAFIKFTDEMIEDFDFIVSNINNRGLYQLGLVEETQVLNGTGAANTLVGLLNRSGIQTEAAAAGGADNADAIFRAMMKVQIATGFAADGIVIHPLDYQALRLTKDANEQYMGGGFFTGQYGNGAVLEQPPLWGLRTVVTAAMPQGTVAVGAFRQAATLYRKGGVRVESTNSHDVDFTSNLVTTRIEERVALEVKFPAALVEVTLGAAA